MPTVLSEEQRQTLEKVFDRLDTDGSDELDMEELKAALRTSSFKLTAMELKKLWTTADKNADSSLSKDEFVKAVEALEDGTDKEQALREKMTEADEDKMCCLQ